MKDNVINNLIDKAYCINLERRVDRKEHMKKEFEKIGINYQFFQAFDGKSLDIEESTILKSIIATVRSHVGVIKDAIMNNYNIIAVFEDDVIFCEDFDERLKIYLEEVPSDWEIMYLGCHFNSCKFPNKVKNNVFSVKECFGCFSMILNNKNGLFEKILKIRNEKKPYDNHIKENVLPTTKAYVFIPFFVRTLNTTSDISERKDSFSYDVVDKLFKDRIEIKMDIANPKILTKSNKDECDEFLKSKELFQIYHKGELIFDGEKMNKNDLFFHENNFTLNKKEFSYMGMTIKKKNN